MKVISKRVVENAKIQGNTYADCDPKFFAQKLLGGPSCLNVLLLGGIYLFNI